MLLGNSKCVRRRGKKVAQLAEPDEPDELVSGRLAGARAIRLVRLIYIHTYIRWTREGPCRAGWVPKRDPLAQLRALLGDQKTILCVWIFFSIMPNLKSPRTGKKKNETENENEYDN